MAGSQTEQEASLVADGVKNVGSRSSSGHRTFPTFVGIGSMRCGSTWLYQVLQCHPDIRMGNLKEVDFFFFPSDVALRSALVRDTFCTATQMDQSRYGAKSLRDMPD